MKTKQIKLPGPDHPISIERNPARVVVSVAGRVIADTRSALTLREATYPPVEYIPRKDVDFSQLSLSTHCSTSVTIRRLSAIGPLTTSSTALTLNQAARSLQSYQEPSANVEVRTGNGRGRRRLCNRARAILGFRPAGELDSGGHLAHRESCSC